VGVPQKTHWVFFWVRTQVSESWLMENLVLYFLFVVKLKCQLDNTSIYVNYSLQILEVIEFDVQQ